MTNNRKSNVPQRKTVGVYDRPKSADRKFFVDPKFLIIGIIVLGIVLYFVVHHFRH